MSIPHSTCYLWHNKDQSGGVDALTDKAFMPSRVWNRFSDNIPAQIIDLALEEPELSPRELAVRFTDTKSYFVSESSVYRLLKAHNLITSPAFIVIKAANEFKGAGQPTKKAKSEASSITITTIDITRVFKTSHRLVPILDALNQS